MTVAQDDLTELMRLLGLSTHARPTSPHRVFQDEVLPRVKEWRKVLRTVQAEATQTDGEDNTYTISGTTYDRVWDAATDSPKPIFRRSA